MIYANPLEPDFKTLLESDAHLVVSDMKTEKGGQGAGMGPHDLLEAAMAACMSITLRMAGNKYGIPVGKSVVAVELDRSDEDIARFRYEVKFDEEVPQDQRQRLVEILGRCPVSKTISREIVMESVTGL